MEPQTLNVQKLPDSIDPQRLYYANVSANSIEVRKRSDDELIGFFTKSKSSQLEKITAEQIIKNKNYRQKLYTVGGQFQIVAMNLSPSQEIGSEVHPQTVQCVQVVQGIVNAEVGEKKTKMFAGDIVVVNPGSMHNFINASKKNSAKLLVFYSPPEH